jgi:hypothetical protein
MAQTQTKTLAGSHTTAIRFSAMVEIIYPHPDGLSALERYRISMAHAGDDLVAQLPVFQTYAHDRFVELNGREPSFEQDAVDWNEPELRRSIYHPTPQEQAASTGLAAAARDRARARKQRSN